MSDNREPQWRPGGRVVKEHRHRLAAPREKVFPLLCPVREYEWIATWSCEMVHSRSGVAEDGCVFTTDFPAPGPATWVVSRYQPPASIGFVIFYPGLMTERLDLDLRALEGPGEGCQLTWRRAYTALSPRGEEFLAQELDGLFATGMAARQQDLEYYLAQGRLRPGP